MYKWYCFAPARPFGVASSGEKSDTTGGVLWGGKIVSIVTFANRSMPLRRSKARFMLALLESEQSVVWNAMLSSLEMI